MPLLSPRQGGETNSRRLVSLAWSWYIAPMYTLDPRLQQDTHAVTHLELCELRLMDDARFDWLILIPRRAGLREIHQLAPTERQQLIEESARVALALEQIARPAKINHGALGNVVAQLHWHVVARNPDDPCWPGPVWGCGERRAYETDAAQALIARLRGALDHT